MLVFHSRPAGLKESLYLKVQNKRSRGHLEEILICLIESPYEKIGKFVLGFTNGRDLIASMKALPKRKGNALKIRIAATMTAGLNESLR